MWKIWDVWKLKRETGIQNSNGLVSILLKQSEFLSSPMIRFSKNYSKACWGVGEHLILKFYIDVISLSCKLCCCYNCRPYSYCRNELYQNVSLDLLINVFLGRKRMRCSVVYPLAFVFDSPPDQLVVANISSAFQTGWGCWNTICSLPNKHVVHSSRQFHIRSSSTQLSSWKWRCPRQKMAMRGQLGTWTSLRQADSAENTVPLGFIQKPAKLAGHFNTYLYCT